MLSTFLNCLLLLFVAFSVAVTASRQPNIVFLLSDDLGWDDVGYHTSQIQTPNIDALLETGIELNQYYTQSVCTPSRATILTGRYPIHTGLVGLIGRNDAFGLPLSTQTLANVLSSQAGYATYAVGKWHLGFYKWDYTPTFRGFSQFYGYYTGAENYFTHESNNYFDFREDIGFSCGANCSRVAVESVGVYSASLFANYTIHSILSRHANTSYASDASHRNDTIVNKRDDRPFFLYLAYQSVHSPSMVPSEYEDMYNDTIQNSQRRAFAGMVTCMDDSIGNITAALDEFGLRDNTIIMWASDNGGPTSTGDAIGSRNYPLRGGKHSIWEGGTRVVGAVNIPDGLLERSKRKRKHGNGTNVVYDNIMHSVDWFPTMLEAIGMNINETGLNYSIDGVSHWSAFKTALGDKSNIAKSADPPRSIMYYGHDVPNVYAWAGNNTGLRWNEYKLLNVSGGEPSDWYQPVNATFSSFGDKIFGSYHSCQTCFSYENRNYSLYNLSNDPNEYYDIAAQFPNLTIKLVQMMIEIESTAVPQVTTDTNCPNLTYPNVTGVGPVWAPWC